jgi:hypothetical protein
MLKIMNVKMVVDEEGNEVRADELLQAMQQIEEALSISNSFYYYSGYDFYWMLINSMAIKVTEISEGGRHTAIKGERFAEVYAWLKEMLEEE